MKNVRTIVRSGTALLVSGLILLAACKKNSSSASEDVSYSQDQAQLEKTSDDAQTISDEAYQSTTASLSTFKTEGTTYSPCATITKDTVNRIITVNFGTTDCLCLDKNYRRGEVIITYTGHYMDLGSVHTISFNNYFVNDNQVTGSKTVTNGGTNTQGQTFWNIVVNDSIILANNAGTISWTATRTRTLTSSSPEQYSITGSGSLTRANGAVVTHVVNTPLIITKGCPWIEQGTVTNTLSNGKTAVVDYGNGTCDALATVTYNGRTYNVTLRR